VFSLQDEAEDGEEKEKVDVMMHNDMLSCMVTCICQGAAKKPLLYAIAEAF
jgi:hypothetical protein